jgi:hypothetical protein
MSLVLLLPPELSLLLLVSPSATDTVVDRSPGATVLLLKVAQASLLPPSSNMLV